MKKEDPPEVPLVNDKDQDRKLIKWAPVFMDCLDRTFGARGPLSYVVRKTVAVPSVMVDTLMTTGDPAHVSAHYGSSGSLLAELTARLPHTGTIFKTDNATVYMMIEKATRDTSVASTVKAFSRTKNGREAYLALIANHAGDEKYRAITKKRVNFLQNTKWTGRQSPLETHVSLHRSAHDDLRECNNHITVNVPDASQRVEYLIDSISCADSTLQASIGLIRANTNNMRNDFESAASSLIEVDPYRRGSKTAEATVSAIDFNAGRGNSGVDLRWHPKKEFAKLSQSQKDELKLWFKTPEGKKTTKEQRKENKKKKRDSDKADGNTKSNGGNWKKKMKIAMKTKNGLKTVIAALQEEEQSNKDFLASLHSQTASVASTSSTTSVPPPAAASSISAAFPATTIKLASILKSNK